MSDISGTIFKIRRFSLHDGPGIRTTVFLKGCPLQCIWCHSPEGISPQITIWHEMNTCIGCGNCVRTCPEKALTLFSGAKHVVQIDRKLCTLNGKCVKICPTNAIRYTGNTVTVQEIIKEIRKDLDIYAESGGGITLTGGEPLFQAVFASAIIRSCKETGVHTAVETSLFGNKESLDLLIEHTDLFIADLKLFDNDDHIKYTGKTNEIIKENFRSLILSGRQIIVRIPMIKNITDNEKNIRSIISFVNAFNIAIPVEFINFNPLAANNYHRLGLIYNIDQ